MNNVRLIARLDIKAPNLIKGIHLEGLRVMGDPLVFAEKYYREGADELIYMDIVASLYNRNSLNDLIARTAENIFIPITVGGGIRSLDDVGKILKAGADKVALNTAVIARPELISEIAYKYGSQCMILSIEAKRNGPGQWEALTDNGREHTHRDVIEWAKEGERRGAGEILLTSIDQEGTRKGFDLELVAKVSKAVSIPVIASGGMGTLAHFYDCVISGADAVAMADCLHYNRIGLKDVRTYAQNQKIPVRSLPT